MPHLPIDIAKMENCFAPGENKGGEKWTVEIDSTGKRNGLAAEPGHRCAPAALLSDTIS